MPADRDSILAFSRRLGWCLAALVVLLAGVVAWRGDVLLDRQQARGVAEKKAFLDKVRACRHQAVRPLPSWQACEVLVRDQQ